MKPCFNFLRRNGLPRKAGYPLRAAGFLRAELTSRLSQQSHGTFCLLLSLLSQVQLAPQAADFNDPKADRDALPTVPPGFQVSFFAREPLVRQPCSMAFDDDGRLFVGMGPQYRNPAPDTPGDSVVLVLDTDGDGRADRTHTFATGFNAIQGLAWHGPDLWVANAPDLTIVRDLDGDDSADEFVKVYTDLGNLEHGLHGLNWAPDGRLYMSKGNSKGLTQPGRLAPKPFRDLWGVSAPPGSPDFPTPTTNRPSEYRRAYHDPEDDWGREGGILRCEDGGRNLEIVARGFRNPWDIAFDSGFNWLGTDNDQTTGDRVFMPFFTAHFGWNHPWSAHWSTAGHAPTAPVSGPLFEGSGTGIVFGDSPQFPQSHRGVFFINDWLRKTTFIWRPTWEGALLRPKGEEWEPFIRGGDSLFRPTDLEFGPDGALWILGWSSGYGAEYADGQLSNEGRVFRVTSTTKPTAVGKALKRTKPRTEWSVAELVEDFATLLPVWRSNAQEELVHRGASVKAGLIAALSAGGLSEAQETWTAWTLGRLAIEDHSIDDWFEARISTASSTLNLQIQTLRILAHSIRHGVGNRELTAQVIATLHSPEPRLRFEAVQAIGQARQIQTTPALLDLIAIERDPTIFYASWQTLRRFHGPTSLKGWLADPRAGVRRGVLLALLEDHALSSDEIKSLATDHDPSVREVAELWLRKDDQGGEKMALRGRPLQTFPPQANSALMRFGLAKHVQARSGANYRLVPAGLYPGANPYTDRSYTLKSIPPGLEGMDFIQTANNDDGSQGDAWLTLEARLPVRVHVALDVRTDRVPDWIRNHYQRSNLTIGADHWTFQLYSSEFPAGPIRLGGNTQDGKIGGKGNYIVVLEPLPFEPLPQPTSVNAALEMLAQGDGERGELLFHRLGGVGCHNCHHLSDHGNRFGPDLVGIGDRATAKHLVQSILEPNAVTTEGFQLQWIETIGGEYSGVLIDESGLNVTLGLATGEQQIIGKSQIRSRRSESTSAMPAYDTVLSSQAVADLVTYLLDQKAEADASATAEAGFASELKDEGLLITHSDKPVAEFIFHDDRILRPYFANIHTPSGLKATRNHPLIPGVDATDHETMHPGIWLAFGDISGVDFWRNQGRIEHVRFVTPPTVRAGRFQFATESRLRSAEGRILCTMTNRLSFTAHTNAWLLVWDATFYSAEADFVFGDQEEMGFGARLASALAEKAAGEIISSRGTKSAAATWGNPYDWCDYSGRLNGQHVGITLMASPGNFRPSWWHNRDYGVFVANPFGRAAMKQGEPSSVSVRRGDSLRLRFGAFIHSSPLGESFDPTDGYNAFLAELERDP